MGNQEQTSVLTALLSGNQHGEQEHDHQASHPEDVIGYTSLMGEKHPDAQRRGAEGEHGIFVHVEREAQRNQFGIEQGQTRDEERHGRKNERHQFRP